MNHMTSSRLKPEGQQFEQMLTLHEDAFYEFFRLGMIFGVASDWKHLVRIWNW
jgi:hypothetical protein